MKVKTIKFTRNSSCHPDVRTLRFHHPMGDTLVMDNVIFACRFGSHLHGTTTPTSDLDIKAVFIEDVDNTLLGEYRHTENISTGGEEVRNTTEDVDIEFIELRKFLDDAMKGQTYAVELLFCDEANLLYASPFWDSLLTYRDRLVTKNVKPFIGYCVAQAKKYGLKGERLSATEEVLGALKELPPKERLENVLDQIPRNDYCKVYTKTLETNKSDQPNEQTMLVINDKEFNIEVKVDYIIPVIQRVVDRYGKRARKARDGVDWKAVCHAYRCIYELEELLTTGQITFPLKDREFLLEVKKGQVPYEQVQEDLPEMIDRVESLDSDLPTQPDFQFWKEWMLDVYHTVFDIRRSGKLRYLEAQRIRQKRLDDLATPLSEPLEVLNRTKEFLSKYDDEEEDDE